MVFSTLPIDLVSHEVLDRDMVVISPLYLLTKQLQARCRAFYVPRKPEIDNFIGRVLPREKVSSYTSFFLAERGVLAEDSRQIARVISEVASRIADLNGAQKISVSFLYQDTGASWLPHVDFSRSNAELWSGGSSFVARKAGAFVVLFGQQTYGAPSGRRYSPAIDMYVSAGLARDWDKLLKASALLAKGITLVEIPERYCCFFRRLGWVHSGPSVVKKMRLVCRVQEPI